MGDARKKRDSINLFRGAAALLLAASLLCTLAGQTLAASEPVSSPVSDNRPAVVIEGNAVVDSNGQPTGFFELSMKVRTKFYLDAEGKLVDSTSAVETLDHPFRSAAVALRYDAELLTPVSWSYTLEDYAADVPGLDVSGANALKPAYLETKKPDSGVSATAKVESYTASDANNSGRPTAQLVLSAEAGGTAVSYEQETAVCVVRFKYDLDRVTMRAGDNYAFLRPAATPTGADGKKFCVVWFAEDAVAAKSSAGQSVWYQGTKSMAETAQADRTYFYYYLDAPAMTAAGAPKTDGGTIFTGSPVKDYTSNLLSLQETGDPAMPGKVQFKLVNMPSYASGGVNMANMATILFYDWDDALLGVLTVEKGDARAAVNAYVEEKMIYPDLWASKHAGDAAYMESLDRAYTYRGTYPAEGPSGSTTVTDGDKYALTNKLDYAFYRRPTELVEPAPTDPEGTAAYWEVASNASSEEAYPYVNGWAVVADIKDIENVWTTFGAGELKDVNPSDPSGRYTTAGTAANYFKLEDFSNLAAGVHYVKACYEPGTLLDAEGSYSMIGDLAYSRYANVATSSVGSAFSIKYQYGRISANSQVGVQRTRTPAVKLYYTVDREGLADQSFYIEVGVGNTDLMDVEFTPTGNFLTMEYALVEKYGVANFVEGVSRTTYGNTNGILSSFNYDDGWSYDNRLGSIGFVYQGTLNQIMILGTEAIQTGNSDDFTRALNYQTLWDLNLRMDASGTQPESAPDATIMAQQILDAIDKVLAYGGPGMRDVNGNAVLDWHQLQYHIIHYAGGGILSGGSIMSAQNCIDADGGYLWCHQDECGGGSGTIASLTDLLKAAYKVYGGSWPTALDQLGVALLDNQYLRADMKGITYPSDLADFKAALNIAIGALVTDGPYDAATIGNATWKELQYALIFGAYKKDANITETFWWQNGQAPAMNNLVQLLEYAFKGYVGGYHPDILRNVNLALANKIYLRADADGGKFVDTNAFLAALRPAMLELATAGYNTFTISTANWIELQHLLFAGNTYRAAADLRADSTIDYWWENGGSPSINTAGELMRAAYGVYINGGDAAAIGGATIDKIKNLFLRTNADGDAYTSNSAIMAALKLAVEALAANGYDAETIGDAPWEEIQYALIHGEYKAKDEITEDYWWKDGGSPVISILADLLKYGYKVYAAGGSTDLLKGVDLDLVNKLFFRKDMAGAMFSNLAAFNTAYKNAVLALAAHYGAADIETATWKEFQYALIHGSYAAEDDIHDDYWWQDGGTKTISTLADLLTAAYFVYGDGSQPNALDALPGLDTLNGSPFWLRKDTDGNEFATMVEFKAAVRTAIMSVSDYGLSASNIATVTWLEFQHVLLGNHFTPESALIGSSINYWWKDGNPKPTGIPVEQVVTQIVELASQLNANMGERSDTDTLVALCAQYVDGLLFQDAVGNAYTAATLQTEIEHMVDRVYTDWVEEFIDPNFYYVRMTWTEVQYYLINHSFRPEASCPSYGWKPSLVPSASGFSIMEMEPILEELDVEGMPLIGEGPVGEDTIAVPPDEEVPTLTEPAEEDAVASPEEEMSTPEETAWETPNSTTLPEEDAIPETPGADQNETAPVSLTNSACTYRVGRGLAPAMSLASPTPVPAATDVFPALVSADAPLNSAALPPSSVLTTLSRRTSRRKKMLSPANQGGINV